VPNQAMGNWIEAGNYQRDPSFPYRYFDRDAVVWGAVFEAGQ